MCECVPADAQLVVSRVTCVALLTVRTIRVIVVTKFRLLCCRCWQLVCRRYTTSHVDVDVLLHYPLNFID